MAMYEHLHKHAALKDFREPSIDASIRAPPMVKADEYEVDPILLDILHNRKIFVSEYDTEDSYANIDQISCICEIFKLNIFNYDEMKLIFLFIHFLKIGTHLV
jgi:hypothetical protein